MPCLINIVETEIDPLGSVHEIGRQTGRYLFANDVVGHAGDMGNLRLPSCKYTQDSDMDAMKIFFRGS